MPDDPRLSPDQAERLLRAKAAELEARVLADFDKPSTSGAHAHPIVEQRLVELAADIALVAQLLADQINRSRPTRPRTL